MDKDTFILRYLDDHEKYGDTSDFIIHVRIATHGSVNLANCHPFDVPIGNGEMVMMHNGIIGNMDDAVKNTDMTDTQGLIHHVLVDLNDEWLDNPYIVDYVSDFIDYSKLVFLTTNPNLNDTMYIINADMGVEHEGIWYSNYSCFVYQKKDKQPWYKWAKVDVQKNKSGLVSVMNPSEDDDWNHQAFTYYHNGKEGTTNHNPDTLEEWLIDPSERRATVEELLLADNDEHVNIYNESIILGDECGVCTGIASCLCDDTCYECFEFYHECECKGDFYSLTDSFRGEWGDRVVAIITHMDMQAIKKVNALRPVDGSDLVVPF